MCLWTDKHIPKSSSEIQGHDKTIEKLKCFIRNYKAGAVLAYGPTGCGKTSSILALGRTLNYETLEINASDVRNKEAIKNIIGNSVNQMSLFQKGKIILIDEIDALSGTKDRGCLPELNKIIANSRWPIIMIATNPWIKKLASIRKKSTLIEFRTLNYKSILKVLKKICEKESIEFSEDLLKSLARKTGGDLRAAINDLQTLTILDKKLIKDEQPGERMQTGKLLDALRLVFKSKTPEHVIGAFDNIEEDLKTVKMWIDENLPYEYSINDLAKAYGTLSRIDVFQRRILKWQYWRFLVYINYLMTVGIALSKEEKSKKFVKYKRSSRILKMWQAKMKYGKKKAIAEKIAVFTKTSRKRAIKETLPYLQIIFKNGKGGEIARDLDLNPEEITYLCSH
ncbi:MAG: replication factor C large subunit [Nanoarchaeota archaeon]|nr:replication factor C large subunit [Nanoarchaeota archaeon]